MYIIVHEIWRRSNILFCKFLKLFFWKTIILLCTNWVRRKSNRLLIFTYSFHDRNIKNLILWDDVIEVHDFSCHEIEFVFLYRPSSTSQHVLIYEFPVNYSMNVKNSNLLWLFQYLPNPFVELLLLFLVILTGAPRFDPSDLRKNHHRALKALHRIQIPQYHCFRCQNHILVD